MIKILYTILAFVSFGFYVHPIVGSECPGHPRSKDEVWEEDQQRKRDENPANALENDDQRKAREDGEPVDMVSK
jgi:hypothetical protein